MLRVATVLSAREWEARFVAAARDSAAVRLVLRAYLPDEVAQRSGDIDVVIAGAETPWITPTRIASWRRLGMKVVGIHQRSDSPAARRFSAGGVDLALEDTLDAERMVREIRMLDIRADAPRPRSGKVVAVMGSRGGPGRTEIAVALAWAHAGRGATILVDGDVESPSVAIRLGLAPDPNMADCVDRALHGDPIDDLTQSRGRLRVVVGPHHSAGVRADIAEDIADGLAEDAVVVVDCGPCSPDRRAMAGAEETVFVVDATPTGIVRAARVLEDWSGSAPRLVLNKVRRIALDDVVTAVRRWTGLDPTTVIPLHQSIHAAASTAADPHRRILAPLAPLVAAVSTDG